MKAQRLDEESRMSDSPEHSLEEPALRAVGPVAGRKSSRLAGSYLALWLVAVVATGAAFVSYLALRFETVRLGYELDGATREHRRLSEIKRLMALEAQTLRERQRVAAIAQRSLGMKEPDLARVVVVEGSRRAQGAGRAR